jgi:hypothetical protein
VVALNNRAPVMEFYLPVPSASRTIAQVMFFMVWIAIWSITLTTLECDDVGNVPPRNHQLRTLTEVLRARFEKPS